MGEIGGAQEFVVQLGRNLDPERFDLHVVWGSDSEPALARRLPAHITYATAGHLKRTLRPWHDFRAIGQLRRMMADYRPDTVLCISSKAGFVGSRAAHGLRKSLPNLKVLYRIGGWTFNDPNPAWKRHLYTALERWSARWKDVIVVNNAHDLDQARMLGIRPRGRIVRISNGIDPYLKTLDRTQAREALAVRIATQGRQLSGELLVGTVANLYPAKDIANLLRAAVRVSGNVSFVVLGDGPLRAELEQMVVEYELTDRFFFAGRVPEAARLVSAFDVFVLPSFKEGFPWALLEAMAAKVPVVATRVGAVPEMIEDGRSGMVVSPRDPEALAHAIVNVLGDERLRSELPIAAHQQVITKFSLREMVAAYERLFTPSQGQ
jgi:glycosyltransferase involved in cell wall biosynthesis